MHDPQERESGFANGTFRDKTESMAGSIRDDHAPGRVTEERQEFLRTAGLLGLHPAVRGSSRDGAGQKD